MICLACFVVRDHNGQALAHVYFEDDSGRRLAAKLLSKERRSGNLVPCQTPPQLAFMASAGRQPVNMISRTQSTALPGYVASASLIAVSSAWEKNRSLGPS
jgi:hypothetical protein